MNNVKEKELAAERMERIALIVRERRIVRVNELSAELDVSPATIRRDLVDMERRGQLARVHGGALCTGNQIDEPVFDDKASIAAGQKQAIAEAARRFINPKDTIFLDGGSTVLALARLVANQRNLTVVTNSLCVAGIFSSSGPKTIVIGGHLRRLSQTFVGPLSQPLLDLLHVDMAFLGTMGFSPEQGMTTTDPSEAQTKALVIRQARKRILLADSSKIGKVSFVTFGSAGDLDILITDSAAGKEMVREFMKMGLDVLLEKAAELRGTP